MSRRWFARPVSYTHLKKPELREIKRKELDIPPDGFHIVSVGELVENKNHAVVILSLIHI